MNSSYGTSSSSSVSTFTNRSSFFKNTDSSCILNVESSGEKLIMSAMLNSRWPSGPIRLISGRWSIISAMHRTCAVPRGPSTSNWAEMVKVPFCVKAILSWLIDTFVSSLASGKPRCLITSGWLDMRFTARMVKERSRAKSFPKWSITPPNPGRKRMKGSSSLAVIAPLPLNLRNRKKLPIKAATVTIRIKIYLMRNQST
mmetsp:Transcript_10831/g.27388  ORF Transcript_10831/g.27388 Transcript_10831/m.27388 type:complete len:200 (+) Transcript_10831:398-997(+)